MFYPGSPKHGKDQLPTLITESYIRCYNDKLGRAVLESLQFRRKGIFRNSQKPEHNSKDRSRQPVLKTNEMGKHD